MLGSRRIGDMVRRLLGGGAPQIPDHAVHLLDRQEDATGRRQFVIGLDFGTAYTKVVIGSATDDFIVPIGGAESTAGPYLVLGEGTFLESGECRLGVHPGRTVSDLKMRLISGDRSRQVMLDTICLMALILRRARLWMLINRHKELRRTRIDWVVNVGLPTDGFEDENLKAAYTDITRAAWFLSVSPGPVMLDSAERVLGQVINKSPMEGFPAPADVNILPEFAAQVAGYIANKTVRRRGLHLLVDVGAGTVDDTVFNVHEEDDEDVHPIFAKSVKPYGARFLVRHRLQEAGYDGEQGIDDVGVLPERSEFAKLIGLDEDELSRIDAPLISNVRTMISEDLTMTKQRRYPRAPQWKSGVPTFLTGGGSRMAVYREVLEKIDSGPSRIPLEIVDLPEPRDLQWPLSERVPFDRLIVAYGLARDPDDIGEAIPSKDVEDAYEPHHGTFASWRDHYIDKDQV